MNPKIVIRNETDADVSAITDATVAAFKTLEISDHTEQFIIEALRAAKALSVSLVAEMDNRIVGHIAFSPVTISSKMGVCRICMELIQQVAESLKERYNFINSRNRPYCGGTIC